MSELMQQEKEMVRQSMADYTLLSGLFQYPQNESYRDEMQKINDYLQAECPEAAQAMDQFMHCVNTSSLYEIQELFLRSFDVQAITTLDIGFVLFGEDYKRGKLLVHLNEEHRRASNDCDTELSDHLPNLLRLLPRVADSETQTELVTLLIMPAIEKMIDEFSFEKIEQKDKIYKKHLKVLLEYSSDFRTIFQKCLIAVSLVLYRDFGSQYERAQLAGNCAGFTDPNIPAMESEATAIKDFSQNIESEMLTEK
jgi:nitrate reductase assembly molybdenum cofactor insertion protein NarJ